MVGAVVAERYLFEKLLGSGGMCDVYLASDRRLPQKWAVKTLSLAGRQAASDSLRAEAAVLSPLSHPYLPRTVDFFEFEEREFLVMDFCPGQTLADQLKAARFTLGQALRLARQLADVLSYLHSQSPPVIYRDLKPENIMVAPGGAIKLLDFGIARRWRKTGKDTQALGTPGYAAPEQYGKGQSDQRTDIFGLGATVHHALSGRHPSESPFTFAPLCGLCPELPMAVERFVNKAIALRPEERFANVAELSHALEQLLGRDEVLELLDSDRPDGVASPATAGSGSLRRAGSPAPVLAELRLQELEQQIVELESALQEAQNDLGAERKKARKAAAAALVARRALEGRLAEHEAELRLVESRVAGEAQERRELEQSLSTATARARSLEVDVMRYEETYRKAHEYWTAQVQEREQALARAVVAVQNAETSYAELSAANQRNEAYIAASEQGVPALTLLKQRVAELEIEVKTLGHQTLKLEKQRLAAIAQLNLVRDEAARCRLAEAPPEPVVAGTPLSQPECRDESPSDPSVLEAWADALQRCCQLWLEAESRASRGVEA